MYQSGSGDIVDGLIDVKVDYQSLREIPFTTKKIQEILGCKVPKNTLISILARLGIEVREDGKTLVALVKEDREDIVGVNDIAEEFIRVYGYSHIKPTLFEFAGLAEGGLPDKNKFVNVVKDTLRACGLMESVTYSFTSPKFASQLNLDENDETRNAIRLKNPLGEALSVMRTTLTHSMIETLVYNATHFNKSARLFEVANVYLPKSLPLEELPNEECRLCIGEYGDGADYFELKGAIEQVFRALHIDVKYARANKPFLHPGRSAEAFVKGKSVGYLGELHPDVQKNYGVDNTRIYVAEISIDGIFNGESLEKSKCVPFGKFPNIDRDLAVVVDESVLAQDIVDAVKDAKIKFLTDVKVFDEYKSEQIGKNKKSVAMSFAFSSLERTLTDDEIAAEMAKILSALKRKVGAKIR